MPAALLALLTLRPWRWQATHLRRIARWKPSGRAVLVAATAIGILLFWIVFTRFQNGSINAVDFTVYFDRPLFQTSRGRVLFVETSDQPAYSQLSHLAVHAYWVLLPLSALYWVYATPLWLLFLSVVAVVAGGIHILRIALHRGMGGVLSTATALAYVLNDNTARALNYGFHPEVLYAWFVPWLLDAALRRNRRSFLAAAIACVLVKEDAVLLLFAAAVALALVDGRSMTGRERGLFLVLPTMLAAVNLGFYYWFVVPALAPKGEIMYAHFWASYGPTPYEALWGMFRQPLQVLSDAMSSGFQWIVMPPHLFLPAVGWRWSLGILPIVLLFGASDSAEVRGFGIYYAIVLVPFMVLGASTGALTLARVLVRPSSARIAAASVVALAAAVVGGGYSLKAWKAEVTAVPRALELLASEPIVLVQSGLYPHAGYDERIKLLTPATLRDPANMGAAVLIARRVSFYPFRRRAVHCLKRLPVIRPMPDRLMAVRIGPNARRCHQWIYRDP